MHLVSFSKVVTEVKIFTYESVDEFDRHHEEMKNDGWSSDYVGHLQGGWMTRYERVNSKFLNCQDGEC